MTYTPWGQSDYSKQLAPGIVQHSTPSHGGIHVEAELNKQIHPAWRHDDGWYEEDCDWAIVAFTFPKAFKPEHVELATESLKDSSPHAYMEATGKKLELSDSRKLREDAWKETHKNDLQVLSASGSWHNNVPKGMVGVSVCKGGHLPNGRHADKERYFLVPEPEYKPDLIIQEGQYQETGSDFCPLVAVAK